MLSTSTAPIAANRQLVPVGRVRTLFRRPERRRRLPAPSSAPAAISAATAHQLLAVQMANLPTARRPVPARPAAGLVVAAVTVAGAALLLLGGAL